MLDTKEIDITLRQLTNNKWFKNQTKIKKYELEHNWLNIKENVKKLRTEVKVDMSQK